MTSSFLENLKKSVDNGEFNSEAAKKIIEVDKLADEKKNALDLVQDRLEKSGYAKSVTEEEATALNSQYEIEMEAIKKKDEENKKIAEMHNIADNSLRTLLEIEDMVKASIIDMFSYVDELNSEFGNEFKNENLIFGELSQKLKQIQSKYSSIINN
jgi:hypothetical protein